MNVTFRAVLAKLAHDQKVILTGVGLGHLKSDSIPLRLTCVVGFERV